MRTYSVVLSLLLFSSSRLVIEGEAFAEVCSVGGSDGEATSFFSSPASSSSDELLSESSLPSDSVAECFECSELFDFEGDFEGDCEPDCVLDCDEDEEDWDEVEEDRRRVFGEGARRQGSTH